jgi:hypothetical protein
MMLPATANERSSLLYFLRELLLKFWPLCAVLC